MLYFLCEALAVIGFFGFCVMLVAMGIAFEDYKTEVGWHIACALLAATCLWVGAWSISNLDWRKESVKVGAAEYVATKEGAPHWQWKKPDATKEQKKHHKKAEAEEE